MLPAFLLSLREGLEAALILGILLGALKRFGQAQYQKSIWRGALTAGILSLLLALVLNWVGAELEGNAEAVFEGITMLAAAALVTGMILWMRKSKPNSRGKMEQNVQSAITQAGEWGLFLLAFTSVLREGIELALFLIAASFNSDAPSILSGALLGLLSAFILGWVIYTSTARLNMRWFFLVTNLLLILFAAGLIGHGIHELNEAGVIPAVVEEIWNINGVLSDKSPLGLLLTALFGYNGNPSLTEAIAYGGYLAIIAWTLNLPARRQVRQAV